MNYPSVSKLCEWMAIPHKTDSDFERDAIDALPELRLLLANEKKLEATIEQQNKQLAKLKATLANISISVYPDPGSYMTLAEDALNRL